MTMQSLCILLAVSACGAAAPGQEPATAIDLTGGFADHIMDKPGGRIDWTGGYILADGIGDAVRGEFGKQRELLAHEAARQAAMRNALALAKGIPVDISGIVSDMKNGAVRIEGVIKGHQEVSFRWYPDRDPPQAEVTVRVPLWGVKGVASVFRSGHLARQKQADAPRPPLVVDRVDVSDFILLIDVRGMGCSGCLFPVIGDANGRVLYDATILPSELLGRMPMARYVESELSFDDLQAAVESDRPLRFMLASFQPEQEQVMKSGAATQPAEEPTSQPAKNRSKRRAKRRMAVRAAQTVGEGNVKVVLTKQDVDRIRRSPEGASALRNAHVVIVTDSAAAGIEGRLILDADTALAQAP